MTLTHHPVTPQSFAALVTAYWAGFTVNISCESEQDADWLISLGLPAVLAVPSDRTGTWTTEGGNTVVTCPAADGKGVTCSTCQLCYSRKSDCIIAFPVHGTAWRKAEAALSLPD